MVSREVKIVHFDAKVIHYVIAKKCFSFLKCETSILRVGSHIIFFTFYVVALFLVHSCIQIRQFLKAVPRVNVITIV